MGHENWQQARLIPTSGISGQEEAERRATSALLAVMGAVKEFGQGLLKPLGAPAGNVETFIEVPFKLGERTIYPDGLAEVTRGKRSWVSLIEVKTGTAELGREQVESYLDVARDRGFDAVITIANQLAPAPGVHPVDVDKRKLRKVVLHHLSWAEILTLAVQHRVHRGIADPDQAWILGELIRYLEHPKSGALDFTDMGSHWVSIRDALAAGTLRANDRGLLEVVSRWEQLLRFAALRLGRELGADVQVQLSRKEQNDPSVRIALQCASLVENGTLSGALRIPDAVGTLDVLTDLRAGTVCVSVDMDAPRGGRPATQVNWLIRQLRDAPDGLRIDAFAQGSRGSTSELLRTARENPGVLLVDPKRDLRVFRVAAMSSAGAKRGVGRGSFIDSVLTAVDGFYGTVLQQLRAWQPKAPRLPGSTKTAAEEAGIEINPPAQDLRESDMEVVEVARTADEAETAKVEEEVVSTVSSPDDEGLMSWNQAQERLEHERRVERGGVSGLR